MALRERLGAPCVLVFVFACVTASCEEDAASECKAHVSNIDLQTPTVSYRRDVQPVIDQRCALVACHGGASGDVTLYANDPARTRQAIVNVSSRQLSTMKLVAPGNPSNSFLMRKIDGDMCLLACDRLGGRSRSPEERCGDRMPQGVEQLDLATRDIFRRWIAQGAGDN